jgi:uncharacterized protein
MRASLFALLLASALAASSSFGAMQETGRVPDAKVKDIWQPARTPVGGTSWALLETAKLNDRTDKDGIIYTKPTFPASIKALNGKQVKVAGWMMPLDNAKAQKHWVLLGYPPGCPFHFHALPNQFIEVRSAVPFPVNESKLHVITGTLELTGYDESGIFFRLVNARPA